MDPLYRASIGAFLIAGLLSAQTDFSFSEPGSRRTFRLAEPSTLSTNSKGAVTKTTGPVFYDVRELPEASRLAKMPEATRQKYLDNARRTMTRTLLVKLDNGEATWLKLSEATGPTGRRDSMIKGWVLADYADPEAALAAARILTKDSEGKWSFTPVFSRSYAKKQAAVKLQREVSDTLYPKQWHLQPEHPLNLNMGNTWDTVTGKGINMAVIDDGLDINHEDIKDNAYPLDSGYHKNFNEGPAADPSPLKAKESHGTACAGLAGARGFNGIGVSGVAPEVMMMGLRLIAGDSADDANGVALGWQPDGLITHVSSNSWGPADDGIASGRISALQLAGMEKGATQNRGGLGTVYAVSAGNGRDSGDDSSYDGFSGSRFAIAVGAVAKDGKQSSYSESGMNVAISAFGGEMKPPEMMWTTNNTGQEAFDLKATSFDTTEAPINYTDAMNGTSAAAPQVSGAIALLLQANPGLHYRDVKEILIRSADRTKLQGGDEFAINGSGYAFSHSFGAGLLDVSAALKLAADWKALTNLVSVETTVTQSVAVPDGGDAATLDVDVSALSKVRIEHVELIVNIKHGKRGTLAVGLVAPSGMLSLANPRPKDETADYSDYMFTSIRHWGEISGGTWKVRVLDSAGDGVAGSIESVTLRFHGTTPSE
jgi:subtilisin family serine protease